MSQAQDEISELMELQREAAKPKSRSKESGSTKKSAASGASAVNKNSDAAFESASDGEARGHKSELEEKMQELSESIESAVAEIEQAAEEQPVLVSMVAFTLGMVIGQSFSRR